MSVDKQLLISDQTI